MLVLGIIACRAFEDELAHVLSEDREVRHLIIVNNLDCFGLSRKLRSKNRPHLLASLEDTPEMLNGIRRTGPGTLAQMLKALLGRFRLCGLIGRTKDAGEEIIIVVNILRMALHLDSKLLRAEVCKSIEAMSQFSDSILLFYGRCGNSLQDLEEPQGQHCPLSFLTDCSGETVDDCIAAAVGGNSQYAELLSNNPGVGVYCTPMWASILDYGDRETKRYNIEHHRKSKGLGDMLRDLGFSKIARLDTGLNFMSDFEVESMVNTFAESYNLGVVKICGNAKIAERCYIQAKDDVNRSSLQKQDWNQ